MAVVTLAATLLSFSDKFGGEGFEISVKDKIVLRQYGSDMKDVKSLQLDKLSVNDQLTIRYHHCGRVGKNRIVSIKDGANRIVKEWRFEDVPAPVAAMSCNIKDIFELRQSKGNVFKLCYSSSELPNGRVLTNLVVGTESNAKRWGR